MVDSRQDASKRTYGSPIRPFIQFLTKKREATAAEVSRYRRAFIEKPVPQGASGEVSRAAGRFSLVAAAGQLATEAGVLPWPGDAAEDAAALLFLEWLAARGTSGAVDIEAGIRQVRLFLEQHGSSRFEREGENRPVVARAGFFRKATDGSGEYWILRETFKAEVCRTFDPQAIAKALADRGYLVMGDGGRTISRRRVGPETVSDSDNRVSVYVVSEAILR